MIFNMVGKSGPSLLITDTTDANGGIIRTITGKVVKLQTKSITPTTSVQTVDPDSGYDGFSQVTVGAAAGGGINNQNKTVSPTTSQQSITYDSGYTGLGTVTVNAIPSQYKDTTDATATADKILQGYTAYANGQKLTGTATSGGGGSVTQDQDGYIVLPSTGGGGGSPSATQHTIYFEFTDSTDTTINAWYDSSFISDAIRATEPTTYGQKTVDVAELDGVAWYTRPTVQWETVYDGDTIPVSDTPYNYVWISDLGDVYPIEGEEWRVTIDDIIYYTTATQQTVMGHSGIIIGNPKYSGGTDDGSSIPLNLYNLNYGALMGDTELSANVSHTIKLERQITA